MDPAAIAVAAAALIAKKATEAAAGEAGKGIWAAIGRLQHAVRPRFGTDTTVQETLARLEEKPTSQARAAELAEVLEERLRADPVTAEELNRLIEAAKAEPGAASFVTTVQGNARVGKITNIESVKGDIRF